MIIRYIRKNENNKLYGLLINYYSAEPSSYFASVIDSNFNEELQYQCNTLKGLIDEFMSDEGGFKNIEIQTQPLIGESDFKQELIEILYSK